MKLQCPECQWKPEDESRWDCESCGYQFHILHQAGRCPQCDFLHEQVYCIEWEGGCGVSSSLLGWIADADHGLDELNIKRL